MAEPWVFDPIRAARPIRFITRYLRHVQGPMAGQRIELLDWESITIANAFGWVHRETRRRKYRIIYTFIPRKNGKSTLCAAVMLYMLFSDGEKGAQVYAAAADRFQAAIVFDIARRMVQQAPRLAGRAKIQKRSILVPATWSSYQVLSADVYNKHGLNPSGIGMDELHTQPSRDLYDVLHTGVGAREQPLEWIMSTSGYDKESFWQEFHDHAVQVADGTIEDPTFLPVLYGAEKTDDWTDPEVWKAVNPSLGFGITLEYLQDEVRKAKRSPSYQNTFKRLHLNIRTAQETKWLDMDAWDDCDFQVAIEKLHRCECYGGLDLASKLDLSAFDLVFPPQPMTENLYVMLAWFWVPKNRIEQRVKKDRVPYDVWVENKLIKATDGDVTDYDVVFADIKALGEIFTIKEVALDRWGATQLHARLEGAGFIVAEFGQGIKSMKDPTSELEALIVSHRLAHNNNPVLRWMADNVMVWHDAAGSIKPDKGKSREKIDGIVAGIMALGRAMLHNAAGPSVYEKQGFDVL